MSETAGRIIAALMERLIAHGPERMGAVVAGLVNLARRLERERFLGAGLDERTAERRGDATGDQAKRVDTPAGTVTVEVPKTRGHDGAPFDPQSRERGRRSCRAVMPAVAEMSVTGVSTRDAARVMAAFGLEGRSSTQVSRAAALLDEELQAWRERPLGACP